MVLANALQSKVPWDGGGLPEPGLGGFVVNAVMSPQAACDLGSLPDDGQGNFSRARVVEAAVRGGDADGAGHSASVVENRRGEAACTNLVFAVVLSDATLANSLELGAETRRVGNRSRGARG